MRSVSCEAEADLWTGLLEERPLVGIGDDAGMGADMECSTATFNFPLTGVDESAPSFSFSSTGDNSERIN